MKSQNDNTAIEILREGARQLGVALSDEQIVLIEKFLSDLRAFNEHTNLVSNADPERVVQDHVLDALSLVPLIGDLDRRINIVDVGSGAGFPAMVLAIAYRNSQVLMIDSVGKKTKFLQDAARALDLEDRVEVINGRAEDVAHDKRCREQFHYATARAVGKLDLVAELTLPFIRLGGMLLAQKSSAQLETELDAAQDPIEILGGIVDGIVPVDKNVIPKDFVIVKVRKERATPRQYPRPAAQLKKPIA